MCTQSGIAILLGFHSRHLAIGYSARVDIYDAMSRNLLYYSTTGKHTEQPSITMLII